MGDLEDVIWTRNRASIVIAVLSLAVLAGVTAALLYPGPTAGVFVGARGAGADQGSPGDGAPPPGFPSSLEGLGLVRGVTGRAAIDEVSRLHGTGISLLDAAIAVYRAGGEEATIWWSKAASPSKAEELLERMTSKMEDSEVFTKPQAMDIGGRRYYFTTGTGMNHYFYAMDESVIWIGVRSPKEGDLVMKVIALSKGLGPTRD
ncbi:MAG: hypothetical protein HYY08_04595 [Firmicutes bacterium]|nr:hypothetical protein [Bacillota bacterium]